MMRKATLVVAVAAAMFSSTSVASTPALAEGGDAEPDSRRNVSVDDLAAAPTRTPDQKMPVKILPGSAEQLYLIRLANAAVPSYRGGVNGLPATQPDTPQSIDPRSPAVRRYTQFLDLRQDDFLDRAENRVGRPLEPTFEYKYAINGLAVRLTGDEALALANEPDVVTIMPDVQRELHTDQGPVFIGADEVWDGSEFGLPADYQGEEMVIGVIDTGISPNNPSFADPSPVDSYDHPNIRSGARYGVCNPAVTPGELIAFDANFPCNDKLIGAYVYNVGSSLPPGQSWDYDGHGSHTTSTAGGNRVADIDVLGTSFDISGVAPRAHIISYLGCCSLAALTASINQAIVDQVDVINYSIGSPAATSGWDEFDALGFLNARSAGIFVATSNGNDGPGLYTGGSPADVPWVTSVANQTHTRYNANRLTNLTSVDNGVLPDILGKGITGELASDTPIVWAGAGPNPDPMCLDLATGQPAPPPGEGNPDGDPVQDHPEWTGMIVVCERGGNGRVQKSRNVDAHGAAGFVLINNEAHGDSVVGDQFVLPGVMIPFDDGEVLKTWLATGSGHTARISGIDFDTGDQYADFISSSSSRGPNRFVDVLNPSVSAPGTDILAAIVDHTDADYGGTAFGFVSGTSMASPHVAGAAALLMQAHPDWTPAQIQSALMTTASPTVQHHNGGDGAGGVGASTPDVQGSGRVQVGLAANAGLLFDESVANYEAAEPSIGGDPKTLNIPSFMNSQCLVVCEWTRTASVPDDANSDVPADVLWTASIDDAQTDDALGLTVTLNGAASATVSPGDSIEIAVTADVEGAAEGVNLYGRIMLTPDDPAVPTVTMPVLVVPSTAVLPAVYDVVTRRDTGSEVVGPIQSQEVTDLTGSVAWVAPEVFQDTLVEDTTPAAPYDNLDEVHVYTFDIPEGTASAEFEIVDTDIVDLDLYVGLGTDPSAETEVDLSATAAALEHVQLTNPEPGTYWVLVQNWEGTTPTAEDSYTLNVASVPGSSNGTGELITPAGTIPTGTPYGVTATWNLPGLDEGDIRYGAVVLGGAPGTEGHIGTVPLRLYREADDVTKRALVSEGGPGDTIPYEITVQPNVTDMDLMYTIVDTVPEGLTIDAGTVAGELDGEPITGVVAGQTITWTFTMPTAAGVQGTYEASTPGDNPNCASAFGDGFFDIGPDGFGLGYAFDGDTTGVDSYASHAPIPFYGTDWDGLFVAEDGIITVPDGYDGDPWTPQEIPDEAFPNGVIAPMWADLEASEPDGSGVVVATNGPSMMIVQWDNLYEYTDGDPGDPEVPGPSVGKFQSIMWNSVDPDFPEIQFEYDTPGALPVDATVGVENADGTAATAFVNVDDPAPAFDAGVVCFDYVGPQFPPASLTYSAVVGPDAPYGVATNVAEHVTDNVGDAPAAATASVAIHGPSLSVAPETTSFGEQLVDTASAPVVVTVTNTGDLELTVDGATATTPFAVDDSACAGAVLAPGASCDLAVTFTPTALGLAVGDLTVTASSTDSPRPASLVGLGVAPTIAIVPEEGLDFGGVPVGGSSEAVLAIVNTGTADLNIDGLVLGAPYSVSAEDCTTAPVAPGDSCDVTVTFTPNAGGAAPAALTIESDAADGPHDVIVTGEGLAAEPVTPVEPGRYWDTRAGEPTFDGLFAGTGRLPAESAFAVQIAGRGSVPIDAAGVVANLTAINAGGPGFATLFPCTDAVPTASNVNYLPGETWANNAVVPLNAAGQVCVFTKAAADFALDVNGYVPAGSPLAGISPARYLDTRPAPNSTFDGEAQGGGVVAAEQIVEVQIAGRGDVPVDAVAALVNVTAVGPAGPGHLTLFPCGAAVPNASTLNYWPGEVVPNGAFAELSPDGTLCVFTKAASHVLVDVSGYLTGGSDGLQATTPERFVDTRPGSATIDGTNAGDPDRLAADEVIEIQVAGRGSVPEDATAALFNVTALNPADIGYLTLYPCGERPVASNVNYLAGGVRANNALTALSDGGSVCVYTKAATDVILDVTGWVD